MSFAEVGCVGITLGSGFAQLGGLAFNVSDTGVRVYHPVYVVDPENVRIEPVPETVPEVILEDRSCQTDGVVVSVGQQKSGFVSGGVNLEPFQVEDDPISFEVPAGRSEVAYPLSIGKHFAILPQEELRQALESIAEWL